MKKVFAALAIVAAFSVAHASSEGEVQVPTNYGVPQWLQDLNAQFSNHAPATEPCGSGELYPCSDVTASVPAWLQELNKYFTDKGLTAPAFPGDEAP